MRIAIAVTLTAAERILLTTWSRGRSTPARLVLRAKMILAAAQGRENKDIAVELGCTRRTVGTWQNRFPRNEWWGLKQTPPELDLHLIVDNYAIHKHPKVQNWLKRHKRFYIHFTPTSSLWLNVIERWFRDITQDRIRNGVFKSVSQLEQAI